MKRAVGVLLGCALVGGVVWALLPAEDREAELARGGRAGSPVAAERVNVAPSERSTTPSAPKAATPDATPSVAKAEAGLPAAQAHAELPAALAGPAASMQGDGLRGVVRGPGGRALAGVAVELLSLPEEMLAGGGDQIKAMKPYFAESGQWDLMFTVREQARTDAEGRFQVARPEGEGPWQLRFEQGGFAVARTDDFELDAYPQAGASFGLVPGASLEVQAVTPTGEPTAARYGVKAVDLSETLGQSTPFPLHADATHAMRALNDDFQSPFGGGGMSVKTAEVEAEVAAAEEVGEAVVQEGEDEAATEVPVGGVDPAAGVVPEEDTGPKAVSGLPPGLHEVTVYAKGFASGSREVNLVAGATQKVTISLELGLTLNGKVVDGQGKPIPDATVTGAGLNGGPGVMAMMQNGEQVSATTGPDGSFSLTGLEDTPYYLMSSAEGYLEPRSQASMMSGMPETYRPGKAEPIVLTLQAEVSIRGRVRGPSGDELAAVQISAQGRGSWNTDRAGANADGTFEITGLAPGRYELSGLCGEWVTFSPLGVSVGGDGASGVELELRRGLSIEVHVESGGQPVAGALVSLAAGREDLFGRGGRDVHKTTDAAGDGSLSGVAPGEYVLSVRHDGHAPTEVPVVVTAQGASPQRIELEAGGALNGRVLNADGSPVGVGQLFVTRKGKSLSSQPLSAQLDSEGAFTLEGLAAGPYDVSLMLMDGAMSSPKINSIGGFSVGAGQTVTQEFRLEAPEQMGTLKGQLLQGGEPLAMRPIQARGGGGDSLWDGGFLWFTSDGEGRFENTEVRPGRYRVSSSGTEEVVVEVRSGEVSEVVLKIKAGVIAGQVVDQLGAPLSSATVYLRPVSATHEFDMMAFSGKGRATTDGNGAFRLAELPPGAYRLAATGLGIGTSAPQEITLGDDESRTGLEVRLEPAPEVTLRVLGSDGAPLPGAEVTYYTVGLGAHSFELDFGSKIVANAEGEVLLEELTPGDYVFAARSAVSGAAVSQRLTLGPGDELASTLRLSAPGTLVVTGPPRTSLRVTLAHSETPAPNAMANLFVSTDSDGQCTVSDLPAADYVVQATAADGRTFAWAGTVPSGGEAQATLR